MADGYNLEVEAKLDDDKYQRKLKKLVSVTRTKGRELEKSLTITPRLVTRRFDAKLAALQGKKIKEKNIDVDANTKGVSQKINAVIAENSAKSIDTDVDLDSAKATAEHDAFLVRQSSKKIHTRVEVDGRGMQAIATELTTATRAAEQLSGRLGTVAITAGAAGLAVAGIATGALGAVGFGAASTIEQAQIGLQTLIGDIPQANNLLKTFKKEADISPFELKDYAVTAAKFASATDDVNLIRERTLQAAKTSAQYGGDLALVGKALADVSNKGKLAGQEVIQFANAGIPIQGMIARFLILNGTLEKMPLEEAIVKVQELQAEGKITADVVRGAIDNALDPKISEKFAKTLKGRFSTLRDAFKTTAAAFVGVDISEFSNDSIVNAGGLYDTLGKSVSNLADTFNSASFKDPLEEAGNALGQGFAAFAKQLPTIIELMAQFFALSAQIVGKMFELSGAFLEAFGPSVVKGMQSAADHSETIAKVLGGLVVGGIGLKLASVFIGIATPIFNLFPVIATLSGLFSGLASAYGTFASSFALVSATGGGFFTSLAAAAATALGPIGLIVGAVTLVGVALASAYAESKFLRDGLLAGLKVIGLGVKLLFDGVKDIVSGLFSALKPIGEALAPIFNALVLAGGAVLVVIGGIAKAFGAVLKIIGPIIGFVVKLAVVFSPIGIAIALIRAAWDKFGDTIRTVAGYITDGFKILGKIIGSIINFVSKAISTVEDFLSRVPFIGKNFKKAGDDSKKSLETIELSTKNAGLELDTFQEKQKKLYSGIKTFISEGLPEIDTTSIETIGKSFDAQLTEMNKRSGDIKTILDAGYGELLQPAFDAGGETGGKMIDGYVKALADGNQKALDQILENMKAQAQAQADLDFALKQGESARNAQAALNFFDVGEAKKDLQKTQDHINDLGDLSEKEITKQLRADKSLNDKYDIEKGSAEEKALVKRLKKRNDTYYKLNGERLAAEKRQEEKAKAAKEKKERETTPPGTTTTTTQPAGGGGPTLGVLNLGAQGAKLGGSLITGIGDFFGKNDIFGTIKDTASSAASGLGSFLSGTVAPLGGKLVSGITGGISSAVSGAGDFLGGVRSSMASSFGNIISSISGFAGRIAGTAGTMFNSARSVGSSIVNGITDGISGVAGNIGSALTGAVSGAWNGLSTRFTGAWEGLRGVFSGLGEFSVDLPSFNFPFFAEGTNFAPGGLAVVGERGPELVDLPRGSRVKSNRESKQMLNQGQGDVYNTTINGVSLEQAAAEWEAKIRAQRRKVVA